MNIDPFAITNEEYRTIEKDFGKLAYFASWQFIRNNKGNNHTEDVEDVKQEVLLSLVRAGRYFKRQAWIVASLEVLEKHITDEFTRAIVEELKGLWDRRKKHGAGKRTFGEEQEDLLDQLVNKYVPENERPNKSKPLEVSTKFKTYAKSIAWNAFKQLGFRTTRERPLRMGMASLCDNPHLAH